MKNLKFAEPLVDLILNGDKYTTWRLNDDKNLSATDELSLCRTDGSAFARAKILWVKETTVGNLTDEDYEGHEPFESEEQMHATYKKFYDVDVDDETVLKVVRFRLL